MIINGKTEVALGVISDEPVISKSKYFPSGDNWGSGVLVPRGCIMRETYRNFKCTFAFLQTNKSQLLKTISKFIEEVKQCTIQHEGFYYDLELQDQDTVPDEYDGAEAIELTFRVLNVYEAERTVSVTSTATINIDSGKPCYANLEISATTPVISCIIKIGSNTITVKNIKANETIYIGSGKITAGGVSKIEDVDLLEFPLLTQGSNKITINRTDVKLNIKYKERW